MTRPRYKGLVLLLPICLAWGCGGDWYRDNRREFTEEEQRLAADDANCEEAGSDWECDPATPLSLPAPVASISIHPDVIQTTPDVVLSLSVAVIASDGLVVPEPADPNRTDVPRVEWELESGLVEAGRSPYGHSVQVKVDFPSVPDPGGTLLAIAALLSPESAHLGVENLQPGSATVHVVPDDTAAPPGPDQLWDRFDSGTEANVGLITGRPAGGGDEDCLRDEVVVFTDIALIDNLVGDCGGDTPTGRAAFLSPTQRFRHLASPWGPAAETLTRQGVKTTPALPDPEPVIPVPVRVWRAVTIAEGLTIDDAVAVSFEEVMKRAWEHVPIADVILRQNRVGFGAWIADSVDLKEDMVLDGGLWLHMEAPDGTIDSVRSTDKGLCKYIAYLAEKLEAPDPALLDMGAGLTRPPLEVVYMRSGLPGKGLRCSEHDVLLLEWGRALSTTLAHEVGHLFVLEHSKDYVEQGHENLGFTASNVMWTGVSDETYDPRNQFSVGQAFWMNRSKASYAAKFPDVTTVDCGEEPYGNSDCPCLGIDIDHACEVP